MPANKCGSCGKAYVNHDGIARTCAKLQQARTALRTIQTWATFKDGGLLLPNRVASLASRAVEETK